MQIGSMKLPLMEMCSQRERSEYKYKFVVNLEASKKIINRQK